MMAMAQAGDGRYVLITGGAGFIGTNLADRLLAAGRRVMIYDNLARPGVEQNVRWLQATHGNRVAVQVSDVGNRADLARAAGGACEVYHFAAQVAVTTSLTSPAYDFDVNLKGTFNLLEILRHMPQPPSLVYTSTNKVYGRMPNVRLRADGTRFLPQARRYDAAGIGESQPLDFCSPYGCSKGAADQYVLDYARSFGLPATVFRMSCIYGPHQFGTEDQGWVAHFLIRAMDGLPITIYGDGRQVRDILYVDDLVDALRTAQAEMPRVSGRAFNIGGGPPNGVSLLETLARIGDLMGRRPEVRFDDWRVGDQKYYVSDTTAFRRLTGWVPRVGAADGIGRLHAWLRRHRTPIAAEPRIEQVHS